MSIKIGRRWLFAVPTLIVTMLTAEGCRDGAPPMTGSSRPLDRTYVRGAAAAALGSDNHFVLGNAGSLNGDQIITSAQARRLALAFLRTFGPSFKRSWESDRGAPINFADLTPAPRIFFAQSPYGAIPRKDVHNAHRRHFGPYYLVTLENGGDPVLLISVSALSTDYSIAPNGQLRMPAGTGMDFISDVVPIDGSYRLLSPEEAVEIAAKETGAIVEDVPELVLAGKDYTPALARWRIGLDRTVTVHDRDAGGDHGARTLFVGPRRDARFAIEAPGAAPSQSSLMELAKPGRGNGGVFVTVPVKSGRHTAFGIVNVSK